MLNIFRPRGLFRVSIRSLSNQVKTETSNASSIPVPPSSIPPTSSTAPIIQVGQRDLDQSPWKINFLVKLVRELLKDFHDVC